MVLCFALKVNVGHPSEVDEIFDAISYSKGASVIRMLHNYIGDEVCCLMWYLSSFPVCLIFMNVLVFLFR